MNEQDWQVVSNKKNKSDKLNKIEPEKIKSFDPIISRQRETLTKQDLVKQELKQIKYGEQKDPSQDWNYVSLVKPKPKPKSVMPQKIASSIKETFDGDIKIKKVSKTMAKAVTDARLSKQWTQVQLAHNSTIDSKTINDIEKGGCVYDANVFNKLSKTLGVKIERNYDLV